MSLVSFETLPNSSRIWIFAADRKLHDEECVKLLSTLDGYLQSWKAHGAPVRASRDLRYQQFLIIGADPEVTAPSGCSIDNMTHAISHLGKEYGVDFFGQMNVYYRDGVQIRTVNRTDFKRLAGAGNVSEETIVYDNTITTLQELRDGKWELPAGSTWHGRLLPTTAAN